MLYFQLIQVFGQDLDGSSFMGSRLRIEHSRDSRDSRRDGGRDRYSPPRGRFSWVKRSIFDSSVSVRMSVVDAFDENVYPVQFLFPLFIPVMLISSWWFISLTDLFSRRGNPPGRRTGYRTIVENLSSRTSWQDLKDFMRKVKNYNFQLSSFLTWWTWHCVTHMIHYALSSWLCKFPLSSQNSYPQFRPTVLAKSIKHLLSNTDFPTNHTFFKPICHTPPSLQNIFC